MKAPVLLHGFSFLVFGFLVMQFRLLMSHQTTRHLAAKSDSHRFETANQRPHGDQQQHHFYQRRLSRFASLPQLEHQQQQQRVVRMAVLAPSDPNHQFSLVKILPAITLAARNVEKGGKLPPGWRIQIVDRDSKCSSIHGPLQAFDLYNNKAIGKLTGDIGWGVEWATCEVDSC